MVKKNKKKKHPSNIWHRQKSRILDEEDNAEKENKLKQTIDLVKVEHFKDRMFETNVFAEAAYGTTTIALDSGSKTTVAKAVLTMGKARLF